jgi:hypothetical protein
LVEVLSAIRGNNDHCTSAIVLPRAVEQAIGLGNHTSIVVRLIIEHGVASVCARIVTGMVVARLRHRAECCCRHTIRLDQSLRSQGEDLRRRFESVDQILGRSVILCHVDAQSLTCHFRHGSIHNDDARLSSDDGAGSDTQRARNTAAVNPRQRCEPHFTRAECRHELLCVVALGRVGNESIYFTWMQTRVVARIYDGAQTKFQFGIG